MKEEKNKKDVYWYRGAVGGLWDELGKLQFEFLINNGLKPKDYLLDIGCGSLRGGIHFISYLQEGHYFGIDKNKDLLDAGINIELKNHNLAYKKPRISVMDDFEFQNLNQKFDYVLAQSVFTHLALNSIIRCIINVEKVLVKDGKFYATFFENTLGRLNFNPINHKRPDGPDIISYYDRDPYHYDFDIFKWICEKTNLQVKYLGDFKHPRDVKALIFTKT